MVTVAESNMSTFVLCLNNSMYVDTQSGVSSFEMCPATNIKGYTVYGLRCPSNIINNSMIIQQLRVMVQICILLS